MVRKLVVEAVGTFFLVLAIGLMVIEPGSRAARPGRHWCRADRVGLCRRPHLRNFLGCAVAALLFNGLDLGDDEPTEASDADQAGLRPGAEPG